MTDLIHAIPEPGTTLTPCCGRQITDIVTEAVTTDAAQVTCTLRERAELLVDVDGGESPFGWRDLPTGQEMDPQGAAEARAALILIHRLVQRHDLTVPEASTAVAQVRAKATGPHTYLVALEADAILREATAPIRAMFEALRPVAEAASAAMAELARVLRPVTESRHRPGRDRPGWASPYGPPPTPPMTSAATPSPHPTPARRKPEGTR